MLTVGGRPFGQAAVVWYLQKWKFRDRKASGSLNDVLEFSKSLVASLQYRSPPPLEQREAIFKKTMEEQQLGLVSSFMDKADVDALFGTEGWAAIMRFAVCQNGKWRNIDNGKHGANWTFEAEETIHTAAAPRSGGLRKVSSESVGQEATWQMAAGGGI